MGHIPYAAQWINEDDIQAVSDVLRSDLITQGQHVAEFEKKIAQYCGAKYAVAVSSGTAALHIACLAAGVRSGDEVITSPITFVASANCILYCGGKPIFADIHNNTANIDPGEIEKKVCSRTRAIIPVHFAGHPCDMKEIRAIALKNKLLIIEDAAHALGAEYKGSKIGGCKYSDMTILSFHAIKHITTGEGGMILTNNKKLYQKLLMFRSHGIIRSGNMLRNKKEGDWYYEMQALGFNYRLTDFQCEMGKKQMDRIDKFIRLRREIVARYNQAFSKIEGVSIPIEKAGNRSSWHLYIIKVAGNRKKIFQTLRSNGIGVNVHYIPVYWQPYYQKLGYKTGLCPKAEEYYKRAISLPMFPKLTDEEQDYVILKVKQIIRGS